MIIIEAAKLFCGVEIDMDKFADCTKRGEQSSTKLYNQEFVHGTRGAECFAAFLFSRDAEIQLLSFIVYKKAYPAHHNNRQKYCIHKHRILRLH